MTKLPNNLISSIKSKVLGSETRTTTSPNKQVSSLTKVIAKNFMAINGMARDLNVASKNIMELVKVMGGSPREKEDMHMLKEDERERKLKVELEKDSKKPKPVTEQKRDTKKVLSNLKKQFSENALLKKITKIISIAAIVGIIFVSFKDTFIEWTKNLWESIKNSFDEFITNIKNWFTETVNAIVEGVKSFIDGFVETVSGFFSKIGDFFVSYFEIWKNIITAPFRAIGFIYNKFKALVESVIDKLPNWLKERLGLKKKTPEPVKVDDSAEKKKLKRQQKEALDTERVRKQEKEKQYTGTDEIVRQRHGIEDKTTTMRAEEAKKATPVPKGALVTSEGKPVVSGTGEVIMTGTAEPKVGPALDESAAETARLKRQAEGKPTPAPAPSAGKKEEKATQIPGGTQGLIIDALKQVGITSTKAHANILATVKAESNFKVKSENLNYSSADRIQAVFGKRRIPSLEFAQQFVKNPEALANHVYKTTDGNSEPGDGWKYRGRGFIQHTGKNQYAALSKFTGIDLIKNPDALNDPSVAAKAIAWFLLSYKRLKPQDLENMSKVNKAIAFADPSGQKALAREQSAEQIYASMTSPGGTQVSSASTDLASGQRQQQKPSTPVVVNAPTNNTTIVKGTQMAVTPQKDSSKALVARAA